MSRHDELIAARVEKQQHLEALGLPAFPLGPEGERTPIGQVLEQLAATPKTDDAPSGGAPVTVMGRVFGVRGHGKVTFFDLRDESGQIQLILRADHLTSPASGDLVDLGDIIQARGTPMHSQRGEASVDVTSWTMLAKALEPLPDTWSGLVDHERRYRERELDLLMNPEVKQRFALRAIVFRTIRAFLESEGFMEVHTPILQTIAGGTLAEPFTTHHNALDLPLYLRIAPEIYLKRLIVGGFEKVYELGPIFRNEGMSPQHLQEFTMVEAYQAFTTVATWKERTERLIRAILEATQGSLTIRLGDTSVDCAQPFPSYRYHDLFMQHLNIDLDQVAGDEKALLAALNANGHPIEVAPSMGWAKMVDEAFKTYIRPTLTGPVFVSTYPQALSPLAKRDPHAPGYVDQLQLIIQGHEIVKAYSELNDPNEQEQRFVEQQREISKGDKEAHPNDPLFLQSLRHGMPPTAGWGMGVDRLLTILFQQPSIRDVVLFPLMKPESE